MLNLIKQRLGIQTAAYDEQLKENFIPSAKIKLKTEGIKEIKETSSYYAAYVSLVACQVAKEIDSDSNLDRLERIYWQTFVPLREAQKGMNYEDFV